MPKKFGGNDKKEEARVKDFEKKQAAKEKSAKDAEDAYWRANGEGERSKAAAKKEEEERKRQEQAAKRAELKRLQEEEEAHLTAVKSKLAPAGSQKVTKYQLDKQREIEEALKAEQLKERSMAAKRELDEGSYTRAVGWENTNRVAEGTVDARSVEGALAALTVDSATQDIHPEKRMKAAWKAYEERMLPQLKEEKPGLKMSQYKDMMWKLWQKSPDNPLNQAAAAGK